MMPRQIVLNANDRYDNLYPMHAKQEYARRQIEDLTEFLTWFLDKHACRVSNESDDDFLYSDSIPSIINEYFGIDLAVLKDEEARAWRDDIMPKYHRG